MQKHVVHIVHTPTGRGMQLVVHIVHMTHGQRPYQQCGHKAIQPEGEGVGPTAKGQQKRMGREQFFFSYKFFFL